jgi:hypothetical protein
MAKKDAKPGEREAKRRKSKDSSQAHRAADKAVDPDRLLPHEDPKTVYPEDARSWIDVYGELLAYKTRLLELTRSTLQEMDVETARSEVIKTDETVIEAENKRFEERLAFWRGRLAELEADSQP